MNDPFASLDPMRSGRVDVEKSLTNSTLNTAPATGNTASATGNTITNPFGPASPLSNPQVYPHPSSSSQPNNGVQPAGYPYLRKSGLASANNTHQYYQSPNTQEWNSKAADPFSTQAAKYDTTNNYLVSGAKVHGGSIRDPEQTRVPALKTCLSEIIVDFDPFSPRGSTPQFPFDTTQRNSQLQNQSVAAHVDRSGMRQTQEDERSSLALNSEAFNPATSARISLRDISREGSQKEGESIRSENDSFMVVENAFPGQLFASLDDFAAGGGDWSQLSQQTNSEACNADEFIPEQCAQNEYDCTFETGYKLGVLMERVDVYGRDRTNHQEIAVVKLVVENGAADHLGVSVGSSVLAINRKNLEKDSYATVLEMIRLAPRPMTVRFKRGTLNKDTTQGVTLTRISNGTFSVGNLTSGNATWDQKYFAFGGSRMDVLQLFISRAAYHECVISLYEKRPVHTQIQSFRLCQDHKISPIKSKIYKGYGNLHYFSLTVPSLRFIAAKFASEDYETIRNLWSNTYDAIERKKRHQ